MREIKFRAWNTHTNKMIDLKKITPLALVPAMGECDGLFLPFQNVIILMQFTGLKDKNGKEIYEGDIVKFRSHPDKEKIGEVFYRESWARFNIKTQDEFEKKKGTHSLTGFGTLNYVEVVGNIYENPELLK
jgi:hypothetical protein